MDNNGEHNKSARPGKQKGSEKEKLLTNDCTLHITAVGVEDKKSNINHRR